MKVVKTIDSEGLILYQDITKIIKGEFKGVAFSKGHQVKAEDIPVLLSLGKEHLFLQSEESDLIHENEAAAFLYQLLAGAFMEATPVSEGKIEVIATVDGLLKVDRETLFRLNAIPGIAAATLPTNQKISAGQKLAGTRIIPLEIDSATLVEAKQVVGETSILSLLPFEKVTIGIVTTGSEVYKGLIKDAFLPVIQEKLSEYRTAEIKFQEIVTDDPTQITQAINKMIEAGADIVFCTGGMSVDPDDRTPLAIRQTGAEIIAHGTPVLPGSMLLLAYLDGKTIVGLPGGVLFSKQTVFDLLLPRIIAQDKLSKNEIIALGYGGYL
ncbi:molybdopterin-binding protein [Enterococcus wangshanyuanii]|uniref:Molybdopterin molybdenumtransferase n=1 Tax=Enterococcus wangshanyuanii TaxID=2005703 RepID=A0ABQ1NHT1_9ENTE|nr:molybdopterin-binding protein [Enterococcus wangshanyuanii]GGC77608.1 molybdenum cofactor biosynthesis protein MoaB [Enterococcus wangshanyuanii]